jgi:hypothetical protein
MGNFDKRRVDPGENTVKFFTTGRLVLIRETYVLYRWMNDEKPLNDTGSCSPKGSILCCSEGIWTRCFSMIKSKKTYNWNFTNISRLLRFWLDLWYTQTNLKQKVKQRGLQTILFVSPCRFPIRCISSMREVLFRQVLAQFRSVDKQWGLYTWLLRV